MSDSPTIDEFQRYLQDRLIEADNEVDANDKKDRIKTLEAAISELIEFRIEVSQRLDADIPVFQESEAVRLISSSKRCRHCVADEFSIATIPSFVRIKA